MAKIKFREERCKGCGLCVITCPKGILSISERINQAGYAIAQIDDMDKCTGCAFCAEMCPDVVITVFR